MCIPRKGTRWGFLADQPGGEGGCSRSACQHALPGSLVGCFIIEQQEWWQGNPRGHHVVRWSITRAWRNTTSLIMTFRDPASLKLTTLSLVKRPTRSDC